MFLFEHRYRSIHCFPAKSIRLDWLKARSSDHAQDIRQLPILCDSEGSLKTSRQTLRIAYSV